MIASGDYGLTSAQGFPGNPIPGEGTNEVGVRGGSFLEQLVFAALAVSCENTTSWLVPNNGQLETSPTDPALDGYDGEPITCQNSTTPSLTQQLLNQATQSALTNASGIFTGALVGGAAANVANNPGSLTNVLLNQLSAAAGAANAALNLFD